MANQPQQSNVHVNAALTNVAIKYSNPEFIADKVFPTVPVAKESDAYHIFTAGDWFRSEAKAVGPGSEAPRTGFTLSNTTYQAKEYKIASELPDRIARNSDSSLRLAVNKANFTTDLVLLAKEIRVAAAIGTTSVWTNEATLAGGDIWSAGGSVLDAVEVGKLAVAKTIGRMPNVAVCSRQVMSTLTRHAELLDLTKYTSKGILPEDQVGQLLGFKNLYVGDAVKNTALEGATVVMAWVWGTWFWMGYVAPSASIDVPSAGYQFQVGNRRVRSWREESKDQTVYEASELVDEKVTSADSGYLILSAVA